MIGNTGQPQRVRGRCGGRFACGGNRRPWPERRTRRNRAENNDHASQRLASDVNRFVPEVSSRKTPNEMQIPASAPHGDVHANDRTRVSLLAVTLLPSVTLADPYRLNGLFSSGRSTRQSTGTTICFTVIDGSFYIIGEVRGVSGNCRVRRLNPPTAAPHKVSTTALRSGDKQGSVKILQSVGVEITVIIEDSGGQLECLEQVVAFAKPEKCKLKPGRPQGTEGVPDTIDGSKIRVGCDFAGLQDLSVLAPCVKVTSSRLPRCRRCSGSVRGPRRREDRLQGQALDQARRRGGRDSAGRFLRHLRCDTQSGAIFVPQSAS